MQLPRTGKCNTGNLMILPNERTKKMVDDWVEAGMHGTKPSIGATPSFRTDIHDQAGLHSLYGTSWKSCTGKSACVGACAERNLI